MPSSLAQRLTATHGRLMSARGVSRLLPTITNRHPVSLGKPARTSSAGPPIITHLRPVLLSGKNRAPRSKSTCDHSRSRTSRGRMPVKIKRRIAAIANGSKTLRRFSGFAPCFDCGSASSQGRPSVSARRNVSPRRANSSLDKKRSQLFSGKRSRRAAGFLVNSASSRRAAQPQTAEMTEITRFA